MFYYQPGECNCANGWSGPKCDKCVPYWSCPNKSPSACTKPNECLCPGHLGLQDKICNNTHYLGLLELGTFGETVVYPFIF